MNYNWQDERPLVLMVTALGAIIFNIVPTQLENGCTVTPLHIFMQAVVKTRPVFGQLSSRKSLAILYIIKL